MNTNKTKTLIDHKLRATKYGLPEKKSHNYTEPRAIKIITLRVPHCSKCEIPHVDVMYIIVTHVLLIKEHQ